MSHMAEQCCAWKDVLQNSLIFATNKNRSDWRNGVSQCLIRDPDDSDAGLAGGRI